MSAFHRPLELEPGQTGGPRRRFGELEEKKRFDPRFAPPSVAAYRTDGEGSTLTGGLPLIEKHLGEPGTRCSQQIPQGRRPVHHPGLEATQDQHASRRQSADKELPIRIPKKGRSA